MTDIPAPQDEDDIAAAEHVLGVNSLGERAVAEVRRDHDRAFDDAVMAWETRLAPLAGDIAPVEPSAAVWPRVEARIVTRTSLLGGVNFWRGATAASLALAAASLAVILIVPDAPPPTPARPAAPLPILTGFIKPKPGEAGPLVAAALDRTRGELIFTAASVEIETGKSAELWVIPAGQKPQSLGVIEAGQERRLPLPAALTGPGQGTSILAITVEQMGGSPTGDPMGPVVATGGFMAS